MSEDVEKPKAALIPVKWAKPPPGTRPMPSPGRTGFHLVVIPDYGEVIDLTFDREDEFQAAVAEYLEAFNRREFRGDIRLYVGERVPLPNPIGGYMWK